MMETQLDNLVILAKRWCLTNKQVCVLPAVIERMAHAGEVSVETLIGRSLSDPAIGDYVAHVCRKVAESA